MVKGSKKQQKQFKQLARKHIPPKPYLRNLLMAFLVGGLISLIGQLVMTFFMSRGMSLKDAAGPTSVVMIFLGSFLTGLGIYDKLGRLAGMGAALPITGFANSITSPAMEFKREGFVLGVTAKMFVIAGPVIVYGILTAAIVVAIRVLLFAR